MLFKVMQLNPDNIKILQVPTHSNPSDDFKLDKTLLLYQSIAGLKIRASDTLDTIDTLDTLNTIDTEIPSFW
jgi:hypothetical protein